MRRRARASDRAETTPRTVRGPTNKAEHTRGQPHRDAVASRQREDGRVIARRTCLAHGPSRQHTHTHAEATSRQCRVAFAFMSKGLQLPHHGTMHTLGSRQDTCHTCKRQGQRGHATPLHVTQPATPHLPVPAWLQSVHSGRAQWPTRYNLYAIGKREIANWNSFSFITCS